MRGSGGESPDQRVDIVINMIMFREMEEMRRARETMMEEDYVVSNERSEATRELEAFR